MQTASTQGQTGSGLHLLVEITFLYRIARLRLLRDVAGSFLEFPVASIDLVVVTSTADPENLHCIQAALAPVTASTCPSGCRIGLHIESHADLADPWHLTWCHKRLITDRFLADARYTHFIHLEDDILVSWANFRYFEEHREFLDRRGLLPGFQRVEYNADDGNLYLVDQVEREEWQALRQIEAGEHTFVTPFSPYCAMYIMDRALATAHRASAAFDRERSIAVAPHWGMPERSTLGACYDNVPPGFHSRYAVAVRKHDLTTAPQCWIFHISNNYCRNATSPLGKIPPSRLFDPRPSPPRVVVNGEPPRQLRPGGCIDSVRIGAPTFVSGWGLLQADAGPRTIGIRTNLPVAHATLALRGRPDVVAAFSEARLHRAGFELRLDLQPGAALPGKVELRLWTEDALFGARVPAIAPAARR